jgi:hypothetical protein
MMLLSRSFHLFRKGGEMSFDTVKSSPDSPEKGSAKSNMVHLVDQITRRFQGKKYPGYKKGTL